MHKYLLFHLGHLADTSKANNNKYICHNNNSSNHDEKPCFPPMGLYRCGGR